MDIQPGLVSVLTPSFNQARWLGDNLRSVAAQTYPNIEHIVMDGGSTDGSVDVLAAQPGPKVRWLSEPDKGQSDAINKAFRVSRGEFIGWLNSDDAYFASDTVERAIEVFRNNPEVGLVYGHAALVNAEGTLLHVLWTPPFARSAAPAYNFISQPTVFIRRSVIRRPFFTDPDFEFSMDRELWLYLARRTEFWRIDRILAIDRHQLLRKSIARVDLAVRDRKLIESRYRTSTAISNPVLRRFLKVSIRLAGLSKVREAARGSDVLNLQPTSVREIVYRQTAQFRRWMPSGER
jgi:glycosyltransferase involved in cell wall biosynthesis